MSAQEQKYRTFGNGTVNFDNYNRWNLLRQSAQTAELQQAVHKGADPLADLKNNTQDEDAAKATPTAGQSARSALLSLHSSALLGQSDTQGSSPTSSGSVAGASIMSALKQRAPQKENAKKSTAAKSGELKEISPRAQNNSTLLDALHADNKVAPVASSKRAYASKAQIFSDNIAKKTQHDGSPSLREILENRGGDKQESLHYTNERQNAEAFPYAPYASDKVAPSAYDTYETPSHAEKNIEKRSSFTAANKQANPSRRFGSIFSSYSGRSASQQGDEDLNTIFRRLESCR